MLKCVVVAFYFFYPFCNFFLCLHLCTWSLKFTSISKSQIYEQLISLLWRNPPVVAWILRVLSHIQFRECPGNLWMGFNINCSELETLCSKFQIAERQANHLCYQTVSSCDNDCESLIKVHGSCPQRPSRQFVICFV